MSIEIQTPRDLNKIDNNNLGELIWWCHHLNIGPEGLLAIIDKVGNNVKAIREFHWATKSMRNITNQYKI